METEKALPQGSLALLQESYNDKKEFPYPLENPTMVFTGRRLSPGHMVMIRNTAIIKSYRKKQDTPEVDPKADTTPEEIIQDREERDLSVALVVAHALIDPKTEKPLLTEEQVIELLDRDFQVNVSNWAIGGATPQDPENPDEVDRFPDEDARQDTDTGT